MQENTLFSGNDYTAGTADRDKSHLCWSFTMKSIFWTLQLSQTALDDDICASLGYSSESPFPRFTIVFQVNLIHCSRKCDFSSKPFSHIVPGPSAGGERLEPSCLLIYQKQFTFVFVHNFSAITFSHPIMSRGKFLAIIWTQ